MKIFSKILLILLLLSGIYFTNNSFAQVNIIGESDIQGVSANIQTTGDPIEDIEATGISILKVLKTIVLGLFIIYMVYVGVEMIMSMGSDEEKLSSAKRQLWYGVVAIIFINIPGSLYEMFRSDNAGTLGASLNNGSYTTNSSTNIFINTFEFGNTFGDNIIGFFKIIIFAAAVVMLIIAALNVITSRGKEEKITEAKNKFLYSIIALIFVPVIEAWKMFAFSGSVGNGINIFEDLANLALFFAGPTVIFFLSFAGYYYITANGDEEKAKKAKSIVVNTLLATLILIAAYTFLLDLANL